MSCAQHDRRRKAQQDPADSFRAEQIGLFHNALPRFFQCRAERGIECKTLRKRAERFLVHRNLRVPNGTVEL